MDSGPKQSGWLINQLGNPSVFASQGSVRGSHVYEINTWMWNFGRPQLRISGLSVTMTERIRRKSESEASRRAIETRQAWKRAAEEEESS